MSFWSDSRLPALGVLCIASLLIAALPASALAQSCDDFADRIGVTSGSDARVTLDASGGIGDDKEAIECAFEAAADNGISRVQLQAGDFYLSQLEIVDFVGSFEGRSISATTLNILPQSIDCAADVSSGRAPAIIRFQEGQPRLRTMTILVDNACQSVSDVITAAVHFTGRPNTFECESAITQSAVDRVVMEGPGLAENVWSAVGAFAQGRQLGGCNTLLGTFKVNRSSFAGFTGGVYTSMQGGAQVDVNFSEFSELLFGYQMISSRQITSLTLNEFTSPTFDDGEFRSYNAVLVGAGNNAPDKTALTISGNDFDLQSIDGVVGVFAVRAEAFGTGSSLSLVMKENDITVNRTQQTLAISVVLDRISNAVLIDNDFDGDALPVFILQLFGTPTRDNAILANDFSGSSNSIQVQVESGVERTIIGPGQNAKVLDGGTGTILTDNTLFSVSYFQQEY